MTPPEDEDSGHLEDKDQREILRYISYLQRVLNLQSWRIMLLLQSTEANGEDGADASILQTPGRRIATLRVSRLWDEFGIRTKTYTLIHEMTHLTHRDLELHVDKFLFSGYIPSASQSVLSSGFHEEIEQMVDKIAESFTPLVKPFPGPLKVPAANVHLWED